ncbi:MAG TPA: type II secretion system protein [Candidatus Saccharimonadales bacterium]|jgi:prepilin-type N-terminal cleavage/methylation domain-containing protein
MLHKTQSRRRRSGAAESGFTIIEVLIVLAIAGLILMIVFLAVPALQRNSRNTQRKNDIQALLGGISEYEGDNDGELPAASPTTNIGSTGVIGATGTAQANVNLGYYNSGSVYIVSSAPTQVPDVDTVYLVEHSACSGNQLATGSARSIAAYYAIEPNATPQCTAS